jgi:hypothetical protein
MHLKNLSLQRLTMTFLLTVFTSLLGLALLEQHLSLAATHIGLLACVYAPCAATAH